jgi:hypothetical protein
LLERENALRAKALAEQEREEAKKATKIAIIERSVADRRYQRITKV